MREKSPNRGERYRIELICDGVPPSVGSEAAIDIKEEFGHRPWHQNVQCVRNGAALLLTAENDYDSDGRGLMDEFSDAISAYIAEGFGTRRCGGRRCSTFVSTISARRTPPGSAEAKERRKRWSADR